MPLLVAGARPRFWIPPTLANTGEPGSPRGMLFFDVDLNKIASRAGFSLRDSFCATERTANPS
jgi:hypothetical protein